jgi:signal transduction histidine kinase
VLGNLRIRTKLALLVLTPLIAVAVLTATVAVTNVRDAGRASDTARTIRVAGAVGALVRDLQQERMLAVGHRLGLSDRGRVMLQIANVTDRVTDLKAEYGEDLPDDLRNSIDNVSTLGAVRIVVESGNARVEDIHQIYTAAIDRLINTLHLVDGVDATTAEGRQVIALDSLLRVDEGNASGAGLVLIMASTKTFSSVVQFTGTLAAMKTATSRFRAFATPEQRLLQDQATQSLEAGLGGTGSDFLANPQAALAQMTTNNLFEPLQTFIALGRFVEAKIVTDVNALMQEQERTQTTTAYTVISLAIIMFILVLLLSIATARAVAVPLDRLTTSAGHVAQVAEQELVRVSDEENDSHEPVRLDRVEITSKDEIGDLARAFDRLQETAARLVERQVASRRNVAKMFGHIGRRTQNLAGRQLQLIDTLEGRETEPERLEQLYRLDHMASRLQRNASSLVVLSGETTNDTYIEPLALLDATRLALGEIEDYSRVNVQIPQDLMVSPAIIGDLVLMLAELMENATVFSPPHTSVTVTAEPNGPDVRLVIADHGIGMQPEQIDTENARLTRRERLDLVPTEVLGLFVVGRLARRHGIGVALAQTPEGGVTVTVTLPSRHIASPHRHGVLVSVGAPAAPDMGTLTRVAQQLENAKSWNGFAVPQRAITGTNGAPALPAPGAHPQYPEQPRRTVHSGQTIDATMEIPIVSDGPAPSGSVFTTEPFVPAPRPVSSVPPQYPPQYPAAAAPMPTAPPRPVRPMGPTGPTGPPPMHWPAVPADAPPPPPPAGTNGGAVRRRVPGANLPPGLRTAPVTGPAPGLPSAADVASEAAEVQALLQQFETGVQQAEAAAPPVVPPAFDAPPLGFGAESASFGAPAAYAPAVPAAPAPPLAVPGRYDALSEPVPMPTREQPPSGDARRGMSRRVPGASLRALQGDEVPMSRPAVTPGLPDPDDARDLIDAFESGVFRALNESQPTDEGTQR